MTQINKILSAKDIQKLIKLAKQGKSNKKNTIRRKGCFTHYIR